MGKLYKISFFLVALCCCAFFNSTLNAQGLENIIVETYYISDSDDATDTDGGSLPVGSTTYRIFVDMAPGYEIQAVYGNANHTLRIETTTEFFNNEDRGEETGDAIPQNRIDENTVALDSWLTMGQATTTQFGIPKALDTNGSLVGGANNDGGSAGIAGGLLKNADPAAGIPLTTADGLIPGTAPSSLVFVGLPPTPFGTSNDGTPFIVTGGAWSVLEGVQGITPENQVLIAQITTDGDLSFELNIQLGTPSGGVEQYVASNPIGAEQFFAGLTFPAAAISGCTSSTACNFNPAATDDDGSCIEPVPGCQACNATNDGLVIVDADGDGICDADEIPGCTSGTACNFNASATDDNGSCIEPVAGCQACNATNDGLVIVDADGDGICDADEIPGCTSGTACNFDPSATDDNGSCIEPVADCQACNATNDGLVIIDADGDGVCDANEAPGCSNPAACNYDPTVDAVNDDGSCVVPVANCSECQGSSLVIIDADGDGVCDADEVAGCTDPSADNFDAAATDDDGSCTFGAILACDGQLGGLENIIVETYYIADANDATDTDGGGDLVEGAVTYRVYVDMAPGYEIQAVYGNSNHDLILSTTTEWFNNEDRGEVFGDAIALNRWDDNTVALDSYITLGAPTASTLGVLKSADTDGAIANSDGFLQNADAALGIPLTVADGMIPGTLPSSVLTVGLDASMFGSTNSALPLISNGGAWSVLEGVTGPTPANQVLIGQFTTSGDFSFELNIQLGTPDGGVEQYVARNPIGAERQCGQLIFPGTPGCTDATACNFDVDATFDDNSCIFPEANCTACDGNGGLTLIDADGDGVCNADEAPGCSSPTACNYDPTVDVANDDGSCIEPVANCQACNATNDGLVIIDADGDGVCNADEVLGCTVSGACNFNPLATDNDGSCIIPTPGCTACNATNDGLVLIDADGDGVCDALEIAGCTNLAACNFDPLATDDDGTCVVPVPGCSQCSGQVLVIVDTDGDGVCDADEVDGCTDINACNYDANATDDDGSCIIPEPNCTECNATNDGLDLIDTDGDGTCDADENPGCNNPLACNFDPAATGDDGSCIVPEPGCTECEEVQYGSGFILVLIDADGDGVCDADEIVGCTSPAACNFDPNATDSDPTLCVEPIDECFACDGQGGLVIIDTDGDGICDGEEIRGCTSPTACNYNPAATDDDGSCFEPVPGCFECTPGSGFAVFIDADGDGVCDAEEVPGCTSEEACNYNPAATDDDGSCLEPLANCYICNATNDGLIIVDADGDGICNAYEIPGCQSATACNYNPAATDDDGSCVEPTEDCEECFAAGSPILVFIDTDGDGICDADEVPGCTSTTACNYSPTATDDDGSCIEPVADCQACNSSNDGLVIIDTDGDGVCDAEEIFGCTSATACNFNPAATEDNGSCLEPEDDCKECFFTGMHWVLVLIDSDGDGVCNADDICSGNDATGDPDGDGICTDSEIFGCTDPAACNFDPNATEDDWSCLVPVPNCVVCSADNTHLVFVDADNDGICDANEIPGCTSVTACNYDPAATDNDGSCIEPVANCLACNSTNDGLVLVDADGDGVCDANEVPGCTSPTACNYNPLATDDNGSCLEPVANCLACNAAGTGFILLDSDGDGVCNANEVPGCTNPAACNYSASATDDDGSCIVPDFGCTECNPFTGGLVIVDADGDGVCDADEVPGCTNAAACNFNPLATDDNGSCIVPTPNCTACYTTGNGITILILVDSDGDGICNANEIPGCTNSTATNFDPAATDDDGSCSFDCIAVGTCQSFEGGLNGWEQVTTDDINWTVFSGATPSFYTGPEEAFDGNEYIYVEASWPNYPNKNAQLVSPCYDLSTSSSLTFAYHMQGSNNAVGSLEVFVSTDGGVSWTSVFFRSGHQGAEWNQALVDLSAYTGQSVEFRLSATTAMSWRGDIAVDNLCVVPSILGCTDPMATNYDPAATVDDGSCTLFTCAGTVDLPYCTDFETGFGLWSQSADDAFDWTLQSGGTASWGTGPSGASSGNFYIYAEASYPNYPFKQAFINTPCFNLENAVNPSIAFDYHMFGTFVGAIYLQASVDGVSWDFLWYESGNQGDQWLTAEVSLVDYIGFEQVQLRFIGQTAHGWQSDLALDNVCVEEQPVLLPKPDPISGVILERAIANFTKEYTGETELQEPEFGSTMEVALYPNPVLSSGALYLNITDIPASAERVVMTLRDLTGKIVFSTEYAVDGSDLRRIIDLQSRLSAGTYFVSIIAGDAVTTERIMVTR